MFKKKIGDKVYIVKQKLDTRGYFKTHYQHQRRYTFYDAINEEDKSDWAFLANYGSYWGVGKSYYESADNLEMHMFAENREKFIEIITSEQNIQTK